MVCRVLFVSAIRKMRKTFQLFRKMTSFDRSAGSLLPRGPGFVLHLPIGFRVGVCCWICIKRETSWFVEWSLWVFFTLYLGLRAASPSEPGLAGQPAWAPAL